jgi:hypothetical protein
MFLTTLVKVLVVCSSLFFFVFLLSSPIVPADLLFCLFFYGFNFLLFFLTLSSLYTQGGLHASGSGSGSPCEEDPAIMVVVVSGGKERSPLFLPLAFISPINVLGRLGLFLFVLVPL